MKDGKETTNSPYSAKPWEEKLQRRFEHRRRCIEKRPKRLSKTLANTINLHSMVMT